MQHCGRRRELRSDAEGRVARSGRHTSSIPVVIETFTFLDRNASRDVARSWKEAIDRTRGISGRWRAE